MRHVIEYRNDSDDGNSDADSIVPYNNGEAANQTVLRRPPENMRSRTETLRGIVRGHIILGDLDRQGLIFHSTGAASFNGTVNGGGDGKLVLAQPLHVYPFATPGDASGSLPYVASTQSFQRVGTFGVNQIWFLSVQKQFEGTDLELSDANEISLEITHTNADPPTISVTGPTGQERNILVGIKFGTTTCTQVINLINGDPAASALISALIEPTSTPANTCDVWDNSVWTGDYAQRFLVGGAPGTVHTIEPIPLADFFGAHADNPMKAGDMIGIWYDQRISPDGTVDGRLGSTPENSNTVLNAGQFFNSRREPEKIPNCIPLFKCIDDNTVIAGDGTRFVKGDSGTFGGAEGSALATPLNWDILHTGDHNPPTTIREALDNTDYQLNVFRRVITVTDGTTSTGGKYNGVDALERAIYDYGTSAGAFGTGALLLVRGGNYELANQLTVDRPIIVEAIENDVAVELTLADATYGLVFASTGPNPAPSRVSGLNFIGANKYAITTTGVEHLKLENLHFDGCARGIDLQTCQRVMLERIRFATQAECLIVGAPAQECSARNLVFSLNSVTVPAFAYNGSGERYFRMEDAQFNMLDNQQAISSNAFGLQMKNIRISCEPNTAASTVVVLSGGGLTIEGMYITVVSVGNILSGLMQVTSTGASIRGLTANLNSQPLAYVGGNNPFIFAGTQVLVEGAIIQNMELVDGGVMSLAEPIIAVWSETAASPTVLRDVFVDGFSESGASGNMEVCVIGCRGSLTASKSSFILDNVRVDTSGKLYNTGSCHVIGNIPAASTIKNCKLYGSGIWTRGIHVDGCESVNVLHNTIYVDGGSWLIIIHVDSNTSSAPYGTSDNCLVDGNTIVASSFTGVAGVFIGDVSATTFCNRARVTNNHVLDNVPSVASINFDKCDKPICMGNQTGLNLIVFQASCTNQKPDAVTIGLGDVNVMI